MLNLKKNKRKHKKLLIKPQKLDFYKFTSWLYLLNRFFTSYNNLFNTISKNSKLLKEIKSYIFNLYLFIEKIFLTSYNKNALYCIYSMRSRFIFSKLSISRIFLKSAVKNGLLVGFRRLSW